MPKDTREFRTVRGYQMLRRGSNTLTPSMEDYLEMIYRMYLKEGYARVSRLAVELNVQAPSASRTIQKLSDLGYVEYHRYGIIQLTEKGIERGQYLLCRHETVEQFLRNLGAGKNAFVDAELMEHHLSRNTVKLLQMLNQFMATYPEFLEQFERFRQEKEAQGSAQPQA
ncbi:MAG: metal-dependent transcriptional regulator [Bacillota bacterium]